MSHWALTTTATLRPLIHLQTFNCPIFFFFIVSFQSRRNQEWNRLPALPLPVTPTRWAWLRKKAKENTAVGRQRNIHSIQVGCTVAVIKWHWRRLTTLTNHFWTFRKKNNTEWNSVCHPEHLKTFKIAELSSKSSFFVSSTHFAFHIFSCQIHFSDCVMRNKEMSNKSVNLATKIIHILIVTRLSTFERDESPKNATNSRGKFSQNATRN